jgi:hypothetical protein
VFANRARKSILKRKNLAMQPMAAVADPKYRTEGVITFFLNKPVFRAGTTVGNNFFFNA